MRHRAATAYAAALLAAARHVAAQQGPHDMYWEDSMAADGVQLCPGGRAWDLGLERCEACPPGKQSRDNSTMPCSFCPQTLMPNSNQSGCVCQPLHFNVWTSSIGSHNELLECTPCASVLVALAQGEEATDNANIGKQPCLPCVDMNSPSCTMGSCECAGGPKGDARLCPGDGYWLEYTKGEIGADFDPGEDMPEDKSDRSSSFEMLECSLPVGGGQSRCLHWSRCLEAADTGPEADDPNEVARAEEAGLDAVYVSDREFEEWKRKNPERAEQPQCGGQTVEAWAPHKAPKLQDSLDLFDGPDYRHDKVVAGGPNCCMPGYTGRICEECVYPMLKIDGHCIPCSEPNYWRMVFGTFTTLIFIFWIMRKSVLPFEDCKGTSTIVIFFVQTVNLIFKDRVPELLENTFNFFELSFYKHTKSSCTWPMGYYMQFFVDLFASPISILGVYFLVLSITYATSHTTELRSYVTQTVESAARVTLVVKTLGKMDTFKVLSTEERHVLARKLSLRWFKAGENILNEGDVPEEEDDKGRVVDQGEFFIITKGEAAVKIRSLHQDDALNHQVRTLEVGDYFGDIALVQDTPRSATVTALDDVECVSLTRHAFLALRETFKENEDFVRLFRAMGGEGRVTSLKDAIKIVKTEDKDDKLQFGANWQEGGAERDSHVKEGDTRVLELSQRKFAVMYKRNRSKDLQKRVHEIEVHINNGSCCGICGRIEQAHAALYDELVGIYHACINPTARRAALLEISIYLYGPLTLQAMQVLFCKNVNDVSYPVREPTIDCSSDLHTKVQYFAGFFIAVVIGGLISTMYIAAGRFYGVLEQDTRKDGLVLAKELCGDRWHSMSREEKRVEIERCGHRLRVQLLGKECFMVSALQMAVKRDCAQWYPQWHLFRRTLLNVAYMSGLARGGKMAFFEIDWRVFVMVVLCLSSTLQYHFRPFRDDEEDRLEMWGLQFMMIMVVTDFGNEYSSQSGGGAYVSLFVAIFLTLVFLGVAINDFITDTRRMKHSKTEWQQIRRWYDHDQLNAENVQKMQHKVQEEEAQRLKDKENKSKFMSPWEPNYHKKVEEYAKYSNPMAEVEEEYKISPKAGDDDDDDDDDNDPE
jgi:hypothetical protein